MDEEIKRIEEKQKVANFEIERRFVKLEQEIDGLKETSAEEVKKDLNELKDDFLKFRNDFESEMRTIRILEEQLAKTKTQEKIHEMFMKLKKFEGSFDEFSLRLAEVEKKKLTEPIFID